MTGGADRERLAFYQTVADSELFLWLVEQPHDDALSPEIHDVDGTSYVLAFDTEDRLAELAQQPVARIAIAGRALANMLTGQGIGLALNLGAAPSAILLPPEAIDWLVATLQPGKSEALSRQPVAVQPVAGTSAALLNALADTLSRAVGHAECAYLAQAVYDDETTALMITFIGARAHTEAALRDAVAEALVFSGDEDQPLDVAFLDGAHPMVRVLKGCGQRLDMSMPEPKAPASPQPPGMDPDKPPMLN